MVHGVLAKRILLLERGGYVPREKDNWNPRAVNLEGKYQTKEMWHDKDGHELHPHTNYYVGGNTKFYGAALFRISIFLPYAVPAVVATLMWGFMYGTQFGLVGNINEALNVSLPDPLGGSLALASIGNIVTWEFVGYNMLILYSALKVVPGDLYEAAAIDGAGNIRVLWSIVRPSVVCTTVALAMLQAIYTLKLFDVPRSILPEVPTIAEAALPGYEATPWFGVLAPAGTPKEIIDRLNSEIVAILDMPAVKESLLEQGAEPVGQRFPGATAHDDGRAGRPGAEQLQVLGQVPRQPAVGTDHSPAGLCPDHADGHPVRRPRRRGSRGGGRSRGA